MSTCVVYDPGTGTIIGLQDCVVIELPDHIHELEDIEEYCKQELETETREIEVDFAPLPESDTLNFD